MPALASELGVSLGAAYHHVADKRELVGLMAQQVFAEIEIPADDAGDWADRLRQLFLNTVRTLSECPWIGSWTWGLPPDERGTTRTAVYVVDQLRQAKLDDAAVEDAFVAIWAMIAGLLPFVAGQRGPSQPEAILAELRYGGAEPDDRPAMEVATAAIDMLIAGLRASVE